MIHSHQFEAAAIERIRERNARWFLGHIDSDYQAGDELYLWPRLYGDGIGIGCRIEHVARIEHYATETEHFPVTILTLTDPLEARTTEEEQP